MAFSPEYENKLAMQPALPTITDCAHSHSVYSGTGQAVALGLGGTCATSNTMGLVMPTHTSASNQLFRQPDFRGYAPPQDHMIQAIRANEQQRQEAKMADPKRRLVKVIIIDPDEKVPLDKCVLYSGEEKLTDLTDQELFFEIEIKTLLEDHNFDRVKIVDKSVKERVEHLEPVKVRDLRMVVVTVASF